MLNRKEVLEALRNVANVPQHRRGPKCRTIYEAGQGARLDPSGHFFIDYASFPGGTNQEVPLSVIRELEAEQVIVPLCPDNPKVKAWVLR